MDHSGLSELITCLEFGTRLHICVVFLNDAGNYKTELPVSQTIHTSPFCSFRKSTPEGLRRCVRCRNRALEKAAQGQKAFGGYCCNGIYEYCHPVLVGTRTVAVIFLGNILPADQLAQEDTVRYLDTFERHTDVEMCRRICRILDNHICLLLREYSGQHAAFDPLVANIRNYIEESLYQDVSVRQIASVFNYHEKYIGKVFCNHTGKTIKEYMNEKRLQKAEQLLEQTALPVAEIAGKVGFNNVTYFNRLFKAAYGTAPGTYHSAARHKWD